ncbi:esterase-like activity of phytase family protein [Stenotrophomonas maltophilia]|uniref:Esterase-like activity of phytase family protein n=1 Tax=Stenotrophomonas riyadhensis TaxID=2859893 RepID=A0ABT2XD76_9GAMM|nr:esterase-like activity of phytase family protein [Stenotrophomonas sp. CFS3442]MBH1619327.1 esterase-like activity of phytase family protein [Stenotrophomonas maltophilia]MCV0323883.1 esterase-like activity of phytase family protein [Stenotrophomonas sp. CFS3442]HEL4246939.1 esterase-like activity of phytase family protein [Stenotrophomonas maltophilia]
MLATALLLATLSASGYSAPHEAAGTPPRTLQLGGRTYVDKGLVAAGRLPAGTVDFLGDTLGSFSSLAVQPGTWKRTASGYEGVLWTLPDRGRNDPEAGLFYDYAGRVERMQLRIDVIRAKPGALGTLTMVPDKGVVLKDFNGQPFTGADPGEHTITQREVVLPSPASGAGAGKVSLDAESLQFTADGHFYIGDEYTANVYYFDAQGQLQGVIVAPPAIRPQRDGKPAFGSLAPPQTGRRNNQGVEGMGLSPDGSRLFVALQSATLQDSAQGNAAGRINTRVLVYDVTASPTPQQPIGHYVMALPAYAHDGKGKLDRTAAQSELRALDDNRFLLLARDGNGLGKDGDDPIVYKSVLLVDVSGASNLAGSTYETDTTSVLADAADTTLKAGIVPARSDELLNLLDRPLLARAGLDLDTKRGPHAGLLSEKWEAMDVLPALDPQHPNDVLLLIGNDNDFIARNCRMQGQPCDSPYDNDNRVLVFRLTLP